jgi:hypothetical protein
MFRLITSGSGAVKEYFFVLQDPAYRPVASDNLPISRMERCRVPRKDACGCLPVKTAVQMILLAGLLPLDRTSFNGSISGTYF